MCQEYDERRRCGSAFPGSIKYDEVKDLPVGVVLRGMEPKRRWLMMEAIVARVDQPALTLPWETNNAEPDFGR